MNKIEKISDNEKRQYINALLGNIYYINLDHRHDRKNLMENVMVKLGLNYERFNAIYVDNIDDIIKQYPEFDFKFLISISKNNKWLKGTIGCFLSHYLVMKKILENPNPKKYYLVLEDDCIPTLDHIYNSLLTAEKYKDLDILRLNSFCPKINPYLNNGIWKINDNHVHMKGNLPFDGGCHYVLYKYSSINTIINFLKNTPIFYIDGMYNTNKLNSYWMEYGKKILAYLESSIKFQNISQRKLLLLKSKSSI